MSKLSPLLAVTALLMATSEPSRPAFDVQLEPFTRPPPAPPRKERKKRNEPKTAGQRAAAKQKRLNRRKKRQRG